MIGSSIRLLYVSFHFIFFIFFLAFVFLNFNNKNNLQKKKKKKKNWDKHAPFHYVVQSYTSQFAGDNLHG